VTFKDFNLLDDAVDETFHAASPAQKPLIVVIDDDSSLRVALGMTLNRLYRVQLYANAVDGINGINDDSSVIILDIKMSGMDGFSAYSKIREKDPDIPIIFHSAYQDLKDPYKIINDYRPFGYLTKGAELPVLLRMVSDAVAQRERTSKHRALQHELASLKARMESLQKRLDVEK
jgi:DNA-binding NtrC family response regulator